MIPYVLLVLFILALWLPCKFNAAQQETPAFVLSFVLMFLMMGFRSATVGADTSSYVQYFVRGGMMPLDRAIDYTGSAPLYNLYSWLLYQVFPYNQTILIFNSAVICLGFGLFIYCFCKNKLLGILIFIGSFEFCSCMNTMRQSMAMACVLLGICLLSRIKRKPFAVLGCASCVAAGVLIHNAVFVGAVIVVGIYLAAGSRRLGGLGIIGLIVAVGVASLFFGVFLDLFVSIFPRYGRYLSDSLAINVETTNSGRTQLLWIGYLVVLLVLFAVAKAKGVPFDRRDQNFVLLVSISAACVGSLYGDVRLLVRIVANLLPVMCCAFADLATQLDVKSHSYLYRDVMGVAFMALFALYLSGNYCRVVPYSFTFFL